MSETETLLQSAILHLRQVAKLGDRAGVGSLTYLAEMGILEAESAIAAARALQDHGREKGPAAAD